MSEAIPFIQPALDIAGGLLGYQQGNKQTSMAQTAFQQQDPFGKYRGVYGDQLLDLMQNPSSITSQPGYQFQFQQGEQALDRSQAAKGFLNSGNAATAATQYGQNFASSWLQPYEQFLAGLAGSGIAPNAGPALQGMNEGVGTQGSALNSILYGAGTMPWGSILGGQGSTNTLSTIAGGSAGTPATYDLSGLPPGAFPAQSGDIMAGDPGAALYGGGVQDAATSGAAVAATDTVGTEGLSSLPEAMYSTDSLSAAGSSLGLAGGLALGGGAFGGFMMLSNYLMNRDTMSPADYQKEWEGQLSKLQGGSNTGAIDETKALLSTLNYHLGGAGGQTSQSVLPGRSM